MDTIRTKDVRETHRLVVAHIARVRRIRNLQDSTIVLCLESNLAYEAQHIIHTLQEAGLKKWVALMEGAAHGARSCLATVALGTRAVLCSRRVR